MVNLKTPLDLVLLIDDDETTNFINQRVVDKAGIAQQTRVARNGKEGLQLLQQMASEEQPRKPDLIFVDIRMSVMDGYEFLNEYQKLQPELKAKILVMLSSSASFYDLQKLNQYPDVKKHISKPLDEFELRDIMNEHFPEHMETTDQ